jgi:hypothetical protein
LDNNFKKRNCWACGKELNIYDFLSDNLEFTPEYILKLWQLAILEFHCCECFKYLKIDEMKKIENILPERRCVYCNKPIDLYQYSRDNSFLKIHELKNEWLDENGPIFCDNLCRRKYYKTTIKILEK